MSLPKKFTQLEPWVDWALPTMRERSERRASSNMNELQSFYNAVLPHLSDILAYMAKVPVEDNQEHNNKLLDLTKSLAEVAPAIELFEEPVISNGYDVRRFSTDNE
tara:strand:- start:277 stop:594 length:318 start_codon:yes stop_codon:yes gene_type:complete